MDAGDRSSDLVAGKVRSNVSGSVFSIYDHGMSPTAAATQVRTLKLSTSLKICQASLRRELGCILFEYDKMGPGRMKVYHAFVRASHFTPSRQ
jgi:hypothetical protein